MREKGGDGMDKMNYCPYCMSPVEPDAPCPSCGLTAGAYAPSPHHLPPGTVLRERYLIGRVLGEGGFGITYIGCDLRLELKVAIKEYFPTDRANRVSAASLTVSSYSGAAGERYEAGKTRFLQEARAMARMDKQPVIVSVRDFFELNNTAYIVMEYVEGTTFKDLVAQRGGRIPAGELLHVIEPLFSALGAMHRQGLIHRDISPENLMLENGDVRLLDFGCARESAGGEATMTIALKHGYAPVEQYQNKGQGPWTDVYALSATLYYCLTGRRPPQSMDRLVEDDLVLPRKLGVDLTQRQERALVYGMGVRPRKRFQSVEELHAALYEGVLPEGWDDIPDEPPSTGEREPEPIGMTMPGEAPAQFTRTEAAEPPPAQTQTQTQTQTQARIPTQTQTQPEQAPAGESGGLAWVKAHRQIAAGVGAAAVLLLVLLIWRPWAGPSNVDDPTPTQTVEGTPGPEDTDPPSQTQAPVSRTFSPDKDEMENGEVLLALLADDGVDSVTVPGDVGVRVEVPATVTKTLRVEAGGYVNFDKGLTVGAGGQVQARGGLNIGTLLRTEDGGAVSVESGGGMWAQILWLERGDDLTYAPDSTVDIWGGNTPDTLNGYARSHYLVFSEDNLLANAVHISSEEEFARYSEIDDTCIVIDSDLTLTRSYWVTASVYIPEGVTLDAPCPNPGRDEGSCTLEMGEDTRLVNHGTIKGRLSLHCRNDEQGQSNPSCFINYGAVDASLWTELSTIINLGDITAMEIMNQTAMANLGSLTVNGPLEMRGNWSDNAGTITVGRGGELTLYGGTGWNNFGGIAVEDGGKLRNYAQINLNAGSLAVRDGGALRNYGLLWDNGGTFQFQADPGSELINDGVVVDRGYLALEGIYFQGSGRVLWLNYDSDRTRHVSSESELRAALADDRCDLVVWHGYEPDRKINLNGGPLEVTKGLVLEGGQDNRPEFHTGGLTLSGENAFLITENVDFHGNALHIDGGTVLLDGDTLGLGGDITVENGGLLCLSGGSSMPNPGQLNLRTGGQFILSGNIELGQCAVTVERDSALRIYGSLGLSASSMVNDGTVECYFGNLYQMDGFSLLNNGELRLIGWQEMMALGDTTNHGEIHVTGQRVEGTLVNEEDGTIILEWEDETLRVSGRLDNRGTIRGARGAYVETVNGGSFTGNPVTYGE